MTSRSRDTEVEVSEKQPVYAPTDSARAYEAPDGGAPGSARPPAIFALRTLGRLALRSGEGELLAGHRRELVLLTFVVRQAPRPVSRRALTELLWGDRAEPRGRHSLRQTIFSLKQALGGVVRVDADAMSVAPGSIELDLAVLERELRAQQFTEAVALYRGEFLPDTEDMGCDEFRAWLEAEREGLRSRLVWALDQLVTRAEDTGDWQGATRWAEQWAELRPQDERAHVRLVQLLRLTGRLDDAVVRHAAFLRAARDEPAATPSPALEQLSAALSSSTPSPSHISAASASNRHARADFVGRSEIIAALLHEWELVKAGGNAVVVLEGDEGMGKTRVGQELLRWLAVKGDPVLTLSARALPGGSDLKWSVAAELLAPLVDAPGLIGASPHALAELARVVPAVRDRVRHLPESTGGDHAMLDAAVEVLREVSAELPVVLWVDDLSRADEASRHLVLTLARRRGSCRVLCLFTAAADDLQPGGRLGALRQELDLRRLRLEPLAVADVETLVAAVAPLAPAERRALAARVAHESGGNPLFIMELLAALSDDGRLVRTPSGGWQLSSQWSTRPLPAPATIRSVIERRLDRLDGNARALVDAAGVYGEPFDIDIVERLTGVPRVPLSVALDDLIARRLVRESVQATSAAGTGPQYELMHDLLRRIAYAAVPADRRQALHRRVVEVLGEQTERRSDARRAIAAHALALGTDERSKVPTRAARYLNFFGRSMRPSTWLRRPLLTLPAALGAVLALVVLARGARLGHADDAELRPTVIAVGDLEDFLTTGRSSHRGGSADTSNALDPSSTAPAIAAMLATDLARLPGIRVVSSGRMYELVAAHGANGAAASAAFDRAAREAGAAQVLEGSVYRHEDGTLRLDLRRVDLATGAVLSAHAVEATDPFMLVDRATAELARITPGSIRGGRPPSADSLRIADVTTSSFAAYQLYERGLRAYYELAPGSAKDLFAAALQADSTFAMAAFYYAWAIRDALSEYYPALERAARLADHASDRERLLIRSFVAFELNQPNRLALADSFAARYPGEPEGLLVRGRARIWDGDWGGLADLRRVIATSTIAPREGAPCLACEANAELITGYWLADSLAEAERYARAWFRQKPYTSASTAALVSVLSYRGRLDEAQALQNQFDSVRVVDYHDDPSAIRTGMALYSPQLLIRAHRFADADRLLDSLRRAGNPGVRSAALWVLTISLRSQGKLRAAAQAAAEMEQLWRTTTNTPHEPPLDPLLARAQILYEMGRPQAAALIFRFLVGATRPEPYMQAWAARERSWMLTHLATAEAAAGDTVMLAHLVDTLAVLGAQSGYGRDRRVHHHARGLLLLARGDTARAATEFRAAIFSPTAGYTRENVELGRALLALHRPEEAIAVVRPALSGSLEASNYYVTRTELEELLARAFAAAGQRDSAVVYYRIVLDAWRNADPTFARRIANARQELARLQRTTGTIAGIRGRERPKWIFAAHRRQPAAAAEESHAGIRR